MSAEISDIDGNILTVKISGQLTWPELVGVYESAGQMIEASGQVRFLVLLEDFQGTAGEGSWGDVTFQAKYDRSIEKIAFVGNKEWEMMTALFTGKGIRRVAIEYFQPEDLPKARAWLCAPIAKK